MTRAHWWLTASVLVLCGGKANWAGDVAGKTFWDGVENLRNRIRQTCFTTEVQGMTLPSGWYLEHPPQYIAPSPSFPLAKETQPAKAVENPDQVPQQEGAHLQGTWVVTAARWGGEPFFPEFKGTKWHFAGDKVTAFIGLAAMKEEMQFQTDPGFVPRHLDLTPTAGEERVIRKCIYSLAGDKLTIAFLIPFAPGTRDQEKRRDGEARQTRPDSFVAETVLALTLRREMSIKEAKTTTPRVKWDYKVLTEEELLSFGEDDLTEGLQKLGAEGWELIRVDRSEPSQSALLPFACSRYFFKRRS